MKMMMNRFLLTISAALMLAASAASAANDSCTDGKDDHKKSEKIAYLTSEIDLTPEEAEKFWPVYNEAFKSRKAAIKRVVCIYKELKKLSNEGASEEQLKAKTEEYIEALGLISEVDRQYLPRFQSILPPEKVARYYIAIEAFRKMRSAKWNARHETSGGETAEK